jgi:hypothetical protein
LNARRKSITTSRDSFCQAPTPAEPLEATTIWMRRLCGFSITEPTGALFDQMYISIA